MTKQSVPSQDITSCAAVLRHRADVMRLSTLLVDYIMEEKCQLHLTYLPALQELLSKVGAHDASKLGEAERNIFHASTQELPNLSLGSPEYAAALAGMNEALIHHYEYNAHHPEHFPEGIAGMLPDGEVSAAFLEMCIDVYSVNRTVTDIEGLVDSQVSLYNASAEAASLLRALIRLLYQLDVNDMESTLTKMGPLNVTGSL